jgi:hypothetical protein
LAYKSRLGHNIERLGNILRNSAFSQIEDYQHRFSSMATLYDTVFKDLIIDKFDKQQACRTVHEFFRENNVNFAAIDGTEYSKPMFDMVIFYAGAYSCEGNITFSKEEGGKIDVVYNDKFIGHTRDISSCLPLYINEIPEVDHTLDNDGRIGPLTDNIIMNNSSVAHSLMVFAEIYLAYSFAASKKCSIVFFDGSLSTTYLGLISTTSAGKLWRANCSLLNTEVDGLQLDINDLRIARHNIVNEMLDLPPARGTYLLYKLLFELNKDVIVDQQQQESSTWDLNSICKILNITDQDTKQHKRIEKYIKRNVQEGIIEQQKDGRISLRKRYASTWSRIKKLVISIGNQIFYSDAKTNNNPFMIEEKAQYGQIKKKWITTLDLAFLSLFSLYMLIEECWKNNILLLGISKDTAVHEFKNHVMPICINNNIWPNCTLSQNSIDNIPNTDRMFLQSLSIFNHDKISVPWALAEYDSAFMTAVPDSKKPNGYVSGTAKNKITPSQLFVRSFIQLQGSKQNRMLRSNVLSLDRLAYPNFDLQKEVIIELLHHYIVDEPIKFILFKDNKVKNDMQNLVMNILKEMSIPSIPDAFGHNRALFIADKVAKWHNQEFSKIVDSTTTLISCDKGLKNFLLYMNTFRENRYSYETSRRS